MLISALLTNKSYLVSNGCIEADKHAHACQTRSSAVLIWGAMASILQLPHVKAQVSLMRT